MFLFPISDIHTDFGNWTDDAIRTVFGVPIAEHPDLIICDAGDTGEGISGLLFYTRLINMFPEIHVVKTLGNHEFYNHSIPRVCAEYVKLSLYTPRIHILDGRHVTKCVINDVTFIGGTLWTDFNKQNVHAKNEAQHEMNDYKCIRNATTFKAITADTILNEHFEQRKRIFKHLSQIKGKKVAITHHKPFISDGWIDNLTYAYCTNLEEELNNLEEPPIYWISGHTHQSEFTTRNYTHGDITFVSNQYGYPHQITTGFSSHCVLEV